VSRGDLTDAYLQEANPRWAKLFGADLQAANLFAAELQHANLHGGTPGGRGVTTCRENQKAPRAGRYQGRLAVPGSARRRLGSGRGPSGRSTSATGAMAGGGAPLAWPLSTSSSGTCCSTTTTPTRLTHLASPPVRVVATVSGSPTLARRLALSDAPCGRRSPACTPGAGPKSRSPRRQFGSTTTSRAIVGLSWRAATE
jgi:Pentapeptide repeats (8 copies)